ncbi:hypothetical protein D3C87_2128340 [compost metagenome]
MAKVLLHSTKEADAITKVVVVVITVVVVAVITVAETVVAITVAKAVKTVAENDNLFLENIIKE